MKGVNKDVNKADRDVQGLLKGKIVDEEGVIISMARIYDFKTNTGSLADSNGEFNIVTSSDSVALRITSVGFFPLKTGFQFNKDSMYEFVMERSSENLNEFVVSGNLEGVLKRESPIPIEVYSAAYPRLA